MWKCTLLVDYLQEVIKLSRTCFTVRSWTNIVINQSEPSYIITVLLLQTEVCTIEQIQVKSNVIINYTDQSKIRYVISSLYSNVNAYWQTYWLA